MAKVLTDEEKIKEIIDSRYIESVFPNPELLKNALKSSRQLSIYIGFDPTAPDLHLGHSTNFLLLKKFQKLGHKIIIVIGDFTARIGDPTGKDETRKPLTEEEVKENSKTYKQQIGKILNLNKTDFKQNSKWLDKISLKEFIKIASNVTVPQLLHREMFKRRMEKGESIAEHEFIYPLLQGYDSVAMNIDGEIGGTDQTFNMMIGKTLMEKILKKEKFVITTKLLENSLTGKKLMSKSEGNYVSIQDQPFDMYSKVMALPDEVVFSCFELCTEVPLDRINNLKSNNILSVKHELAFEITKMYHQEKEAQKAGEEWDRVFSKGELPGEMKEVKNRGDIISTIVVAGIISSKSEAKRLIEQKAIRVNDKVIEEWDYKLKSGDIIQIGPRKFVRVK